MMCNSIMPKFASWTAACGLLPAFLFMPLDNSFPLSHAGRTRQHHIHIRSRQPRFCSQRTWRSSIGAPECCYSRAASGTRAPARQ